MKSNISISSRVSILCLAVYPPAVFRRVVSAVISSVDRVARGGLLSHIGKKIRERCPSIANANSASAVIGIALLSFIVAPLAHGSPDTPFRTGASHSVSVSATSSAARAFAVQTAAGFYLPITQQAPSYIMKSAALTPALPPSASVFIVLDKHG